jgi:plasmid maintenance system killer protein
MTDKEKANRLSKLRKLLDLAGNNPSKEEALAAVEKARAYAETYGLSLAEANAAQDFDDYGSRDAYSGEKNYGYVDRYLWKTIANFCRCKVNAGRDEDNDLTIIFFGHHVDVELAHWLRGTIRAAMAHEWSIYRDFIATDAEKRKLVNTMDSFHLGFANELRERMKVVDAAPMSSDSRALVVKKWELVEAAAKRAGFVEAQGGRGRSVNVNSSAYGAGASAGRRVDSGRGVSGGGVRMIGK